jgi:uncharacterized protein
MSARLPVHLDPFRAADEGLELSGPLELRHAGRLAEALSEAPDRAELVLRFRRDEAGQARARGRVSARVVAECQRCLEPMPLALAGEIDLVFARSDAEAARVQEAAEPYLVTSERLRLADLVEDELLLCLPPAPRHEDAAACRPVPPPQGDEPEITRESPFAVLEKLKTR